MGNKRNVFKELKATINKYPLHTPVFLGPWGRNTETFYVSNLIKLGYLSRGEDGFMYILKRIPEDYNSSSLRKEMKEKNLKKI